MILQSVGFEYDVKVRIRLTKVEVDRILELGLKHYDSVCKQSCQVGGFVYGWNNRLSIDERDSVEVTAAMRELGIVAKIGESEQFERDADKIIGLTVRCQQLLADAGRRWHEINDEQPTATGV